MLPVLTRRGAPRHPGGWWGTSVAGGWVRLSGHAVSTLHVIPAYRCVLRVQTGGLYKRLWWVHLLNNSSHSMHHKG